MQSPEPLAASIQPEASFRPTENDLFSFKLGFGAGNGLKATDPDKPSFALAPWAADLEDDVKDINGRNRDYLLTAASNAPSSKGNTEALALWKVTRSATPSNTAGL